MVLPSEITGIGYFSVQIAIFKIQQTVKEELNTQKYHLVAILKCCNICIRYEYLTTTLGFCS